VVSRTANVNAVRTIIGNGCNSIRYRELVRDNSTQQRAQNPLAAERNRQRQRQRDQKRRLANLDKNT